MATEDRGFASMDRDTQRDIASKGGKAAHADGVSNKTGKPRKRGHEWTSEKAREAGHKGGTKKWERLRASATPIIDAGDGDIIAEYEAGDDDA